MVQDLATQWIQAYPCKTKTSQETQKSLQKFLEPDRKPKVIYTDISLECGRVCEDLSWNHCTSTPHRSETNGIAERAVRRVKEGTSAVLLQSGLYEQRWADSMDSYCNLRCVQDRINAKEVLISQKEDEFMFPSADGTAKLSRRDYEVREPTLRQERTVRSENLSGELRSESGVPQPTESKDDAEARKDFWSVQGDFICRHHNEPRVQLCVPKEG